MKIKEKILGIIFVSVYIYLILINQELIGYSKNSMERNARKSQQIDKEWAVAKSINDDLGAFLFYSDDLTNFTYSIYRTRNGASIGYFFINGGRIGGISDDFCIFEDRDNGDIILSLNKINISRIEIKDGLENVKTVEVDPNNPFSIIIPKNIIEISVYDTNNELIEPKDMHRVDITRISTN